MSTYIEKLQSPKWQKRRLEILERAGWRCEFCGNDKEQLHVHHCYYENDKDPWEYPDEALISVCQTCHETETIAHSKVLGRYKEFSLPIGKAEFLCRIAANSAVNLATYAYRDGNFNPQEKNQIIVLIGYLLEIALMFRTCEVSIKDFDDPLFFMLRDIINTTQDAKKRMEMIENTYSCLPERFRNTWIENLQIAHNNRLHGDRNERREKLY